LDAAVERFIKASRESNGHREAPFGLSTSFNLARWSRRSTSALQRPPPHWAIRRFGRSPRLLQLWMAVEALQHWNPGKITPWQSTGDGRKV